MQMCVLGKWCSGHDGESRLARMKRGCPFRYSFFFRSYLLFLTPHNNRTLQWRREEHRRVDLAEVQAWGLPITPSHPPANNRDWGPRAGEGTGVPRGSETHVLDRP